MEVRPTPSSAPTSSGIETSPLTPSIGVEVHGIDLSRPLDDATLAAVRRALADNSILLFREQTDLAPAELVAFSARFGPLEHHVVSDFLLPGHPEIFVVSNIVENGRHIGAYGGAKWWHSDLSYMPEPSLGSVFQCIECPRDGGETEFAGMYAAWEELAPDRQRWLLQRRAIHDYAWHYATYLSHRKPLTEEQKARIPPTAHPCVRTHPETGRRALYLSSSLVHRFEGMSFEESRPILDEVNEFATSPRFVYRHRWRPGDVVFWDNRSTIHRACPFDEQGARRRMHRTTIKGDRPFLELDPSELDA
ncbi:MAG: TauD/TfdA family dioxygenase [Ectothiorhodospiraceae bacterium]|nr:TauD/TfdA family dioxygenase [Ectothiorhodospiraceae bacterium]